MARHKLLYIELKSNMGDSGPAWIGRAQLSKSGQTVYFNNKALKSEQRDCSGSHRDIETGELYWVSGVKERGSNRHWAGGGIIQVDARVEKEVATLRNTSRLNPRFYQVVTIPETDISRFHQLENA